MPTFEVTLSDQELFALSLLARARQIRIVAGEIEGEPEDRAIAKVLSAWAHGANA
jgi:hypothetical protein